MKELRIEKLVVSEYCSVRSGAGKYGNGEGSRIIIGGGTDRHVGHSDMEGSSGRQLELYLEHG